MSATEAAAAAFFAQSVAHLLAPPGAEEEVVRCLRAEDLPDLLAHLRERLAQARAEGEAAGRAAERAAVVAYLRHHDAVIEDRRALQSADMESRLVVVHVVPRDAAAAIERGEHVGAAGAAP